jgi:uncharacterized protein
MKIIISGGTGFIGAKLSERLNNKGYTVAVISRKPSAVNKKYKALGWDENEIILFIKGEKFGVINLAGRSISSGRWTDKNKKRILKSRIWSIDFFENLFEKTKLLPEVFVQASAIGYYGTHEEYSFSEKSDVGEGFLANLSFEIEKAFSNKIKSEKKIIIRTGLVTDKSGGFLKRLLVPFRLYAGGHFGNGRQYFSWIHIEDEIRAIEFLLENPQARGVYNLSSPYAVRMKEFCKTLGRILKKPSYLHVPGFVLKLIFGQMAKEVLLSGQKVVPERLIEEGFEFSFPKLDAALSQILLNKY